MCGITGFIDFSGHEKQEAGTRIRRMTDALVHRGPDEEGFYVDDFVSLGHSRLAIIDISSGQQPMSTLSGKVQITFNGEIYNFVELRGELEALGHQFRTSSDTEVILESYVEWGEDCVERLNGMFAFAIWDARHKKIFLARDRVGKKPLYYHRKGSVLAFASELKAINTLGWTADSISSESLECYLTLGYIPAPRTIYRDVRKVRAGHVMSITESGEHERQYWHLSFENCRDIQFDQAVDEFENLLDDAVRCRLQSEVPLGAFLSGGLDSSLVVSSMSKLQDEAVSTHSIGFDSDEHSELAAAGAIAKHLGTHHSEFVVQPDASSVLEKIAWHFDEPFADSSALPTWYVCEKTSACVTVAMSGDGGDEGFGGYTFRYLPHVFESKIRQNLPPWFRSMIFAPLGAIWPAAASLPKPLRLKSILENLSCGDAEAYYHDLIWLRSDVRKEVYRPEFLNSLHGFTSFETVNPYYSNSDANDPLGKSQAADIQVYMTDDVLTKVDRMSMAHSLEVRAPLLDHRVMEFAATLPANVKMNSQKGKLLLRALAAKRLPKEIQSMPKKGFSIPAARWLREDLRSMASDLIFSKAGVIHETLDTQALQNLWQQHQKGQRDHSVFFWGLMMLGLWERSCRI